MMKRIYQMTLFILFGCLISLAENETIRFDFSGSTAEENGITVMGGWFGQRPLADITGLELEDALASWQNLVRNNENKHGLHYDSIIMDFATSPDLVIVVDCVHGAARVNIQDFFKHHESDRLIILRGKPDVTFGGIAPDSSTGKVPEISSC